MLVVCVDILCFFCYHFMCVCPSVLHHESFDECAFLCMCKNGARNEEHFYIAMIVSLFLGECCFFGMCVLCLSPLSCCPYVFVYSSIYLVMCVCVCM